MSKAIFTFHVMLIVFCIQWRLFEKGSRGTKRPPDATESAHIWQMYSFVLNSRTVELGGGWIFF